MVSALLAMKFVKVTNAVNLTFADYSSSLDFFRAKAALLKKSKNHILFFTKIFRKAIGCDALLPPLWVYAVSSRLISCVKPFLAASIEECRMSVWANLA